MPSDRRAERLLLAGMLAGVAAATASLLAGTAERLPEGAAARVGERLIGVADWQRAVAAVAADRRTPLTAEDERRILDRLIDEELLVQHGLRLGLLEQDRRLRGQLVANVIAAATGDVPEPDEAALRRYYEEHRDYFSTPGRLRVAARRADGAPVSPPVPDMLLPPAKLRQYLGPRLTEAAMRLQPGEHSDGDGVIVELLQRESAQTPAFEDIREQVREAVIRHRQEAALRDLLDDLREATPLRVRGDAE